MGIIISIWRAFHAHLKASSSVQACYVFHNTGRMKYYIHTLPLKHSKVPFYKYIRMIGFSRKNCARILNRFFSIHKCLSDGYFSDRSSKRFQTNKELIYDLETFIDLTVNKPMQ